MEDSSRKNYDYSDLIFNCFACRGRTPSVPPCLLCCKTNFFSLSSTSQISYDFEAQQGTDQHRLQCDAVVATLSQACKECGFFYVVNHGISEELLENMESLVRRLCAMPVELKQKAVTSNPKESYNHTDRMENFCFTKLPHSNSVQEMCDRIWAEEGNPEFCETIRAYISHVADLQCKISKIMIAGLGLDVDTFYHSDFETCTSHMRIINYYSDGTMSMKDEFTFAHTDIGCFTILNVTGKDEGLKVRSNEGNWVNVKPLPHSFVVNVGDCLKAWSNGRYQSGEHRVVYKGWRNRISLPYFVQFPPEKQIWALAELVDDNHPRRYRPFTFSQFKTDFYKDLELKLNPPAAFIHNYVGI